MPQGSARYVPNSEEYMEILAECTNASKPKGKGRKAETSNATQPSNKRSRAAATVPRGKEEKPVTSTTFASKRPVCKTKK